MDCVSSISVDERFVLFVLYLIEIIESGIKACSDGTLMGKRM